MKRRNLFAVLLAFLAGAAVGQDFRRAPSDSTLGARADRYTQNKRLGAWTLLGALAVASTIIGVVRHRQRRQKRASGR